MRFYLFGILFFLSLHGISQGFKVRHYLPNSLTSDTKAIFEVSPGYYIGCGYTFDTLNDLNANRVVIMGLDSQGQILWSKRYGNKKPEYLNNNFIRRSFYKQGNNIYLACCALDTNNRQIGVFIKFDLNGDTLWQKIYRDSAFIDLIPQMVTTSVDGGFLITGFFQNWTTHIQQGLILKTDANGNELWRKKLNKLNPNVQDGKAIIQDSTSKKIVIAGYQYIGTTKSYENLLVLDSLGAIQNQTNVNPLGGLIADLIQTKDKKFVAVGQKNSPQMAGGSNLIESFAVKFDIDNPFQALWKINGFGPPAVTNNFNCLYELGNGDILIGGDFDTLQLKNIGKINHHNTLTKIDKDGNMQWARIFDYNFYHNDFYYQSITSISPGSNGSILASIQQFNAFPNPLFFVKYDASGCDSTATHCATLNLVGIKDNGNSSEDIRLYPNPVNDILTITLNSPGEYEVSFTDIFGRELKRLKILTEQKLNTTDLNKGIYLVSISKNNEIVSKTKLIKE